MRFIQSARCAFFLFLPLLMLGACTSQRGGEAPLEGSWELRALTGGMRPAGSGPDVAPGNGSVWTFTDSTYVRLFRGSAVDSGRYRVVRDTSQETGRLMDALLFPDAPGSLLHFERKGDTLILYNGMIAADGTIEKYVPVKR